MKRTLYSSSLALATAAIAYTLALSAGTAGEPPPVGGSATADKSQYTLFNTTPRELWRKLDPDRPDATESPITVDAGVWVMEASYFDFRRNEGLDTYKVADINLKVGLNHRSELGITIDSYAWQDTPGGAKGFGDVELAYKYNLWGNDQGSTALALFPFVKIPTGTQLSNGKVEGGLIIPFALDVSDSVEFGLMAEIDAVYDDELDRYDLAFVHSAVIGLDLTERVGVFTEYIGVAGPGAYQAYFAGGFTLALSEDLLLDCGTEVGLNSAAEELGVFAGFTKRF